MVHDYIQHTKILNNMSKHGDKMLEVKLMGWLIILCKQPRVILCNGRDELYCVCVCVCERERERERESVCVLTFYES